MRNPSLTACLMAGAMAVAMVATTAVSVAAPPAKGKASAPFVAPKTAWGSPDIQGTWTNATTTEFQRPAQFGTRLVMTPQELAAQNKASDDNVVDGNKPTDPSLTISDLPVDCGGGFRGTNCGYNRGWTDPGTRVMTVNGEPRTSFITSTPNGRIPATKPGAVVGGRGLPARGAGAGPRPGPMDNPESRSLAERCLWSFGSSAGPVMLPLLYNNNYEFVQSRDSVAIMVEMVHDVRVIRIGAKHRTDGVRPWMGDSIGWWEGNTLVSETTNYPRQNQVGGSSENLKVTERFTRVGRDRLLYQFTVEDPTLWDKPWGGEYEFTPSNGHVYEYACHEGNYALEGILAGARNDEAVAAGRAGTGGGAAPAGRSAR